MIIGVDHLALSVTRLVPNDIWTMMGYSTEFTEPDIPNMTEKKPFLLEQPKKHGMLYLKHADGVALECTHHGESLPPPPGPYIPVFCSARELPDHYFLASHPTLSAVDERIIPCRLDDGTEFGHIVDKGKAGLQSIILATNLLSASVEFWCRALGFKVMKMTDSIARLRNRAFLPYWQVELILCEVSEVAVTSYLDGMGFNCLAFITNQIENDLENIVRCGGLEESPIFQLEINNKRLDLALVRSREGAVVELIQVAGGSRA